MIRAFPCFRRELVVIAVVSLFLSSARLAVALASGEPSPPPESVRSHDYADCARWFNNFDSTPTNRRGYRIQDYGSMSDDRLRYVPFRIEPDGAVSPFADTTTECSSDRRSCTYTYLSPPLDDLHDIDDKPRINALVQAGGSDLEDVRVVVRRNAVGDIVEIFEGLPTNRRTQTPERPYTAIEGVRATFEISNGQCVPMREDEIYERDVEDNGEVATRQTALPVFITPLCREIRQALDEDTSLSAVFDVRAEHDFMDIYEGYTSEILGETHVGVPFYSRDELEEEIGKRLDVKAYHHGPLPVQALVGYYTRQVAGSDGMRNTREVRERKMRLGVNAILASQKILSHCYYRDLRVFIDDDSLWP